MTTSWRGDDHIRMLEAAREVGLSPRETAIEQLIQGFAAGVVTRDALDAAIVARGRTVLTARELQARLVPRLRAQGVAARDCTLSVDDGSFTLRVQPRLPAALFGKAAAWTTATTVASSWVAPALAPFVGAACVAMVVVALARAQRHRRTVVATRVLEALAELAASQQLLLPPG